MHTTYYNSKHEEVPSVTTVMKIMMKDGLIHWANYIGKRGYDYERYINNKADFGTLVHELLEADLTNREPVILGYEKMLDDAKDLVQKFKLVKQDLQITNVESEISLSCETYGGTIDIICDIMTKSGPIKILGDFKTSKTIYSTQFIQLGAYLNLVKINRPETYDAIKQCVIFSITNKKITMQYMTKEDCEKYFTKYFLDLLTVYNGWERIKNQKNLFNSKQY